MSNLMLRGLLGGCYLACADFFSFFLLIIITLLFFGCSTSHDQKIVVLDFSAGLDVKLFV
jgi:hypothetical protein